MRQHQNCGRLYEIEQLKSRQKADELQVWTEACERSSYWLANVKKKDTIRTLLMCSLDLSISGPP